MLYFLISCQVWYSTDHKGQWNSSCPALNLTVYICTGFKFRGWTVPGYNQTIFHRLQDYISTFTPAAMIQFTPKAVIFTWNRCAQLLQLVHCYMANVLKQILIRAKCHCSRLQRRGGIHPGQVASSLREYIIVLIYFFTLCLWFTSMGWSVCNPTVRETHQNHRKNKVLFFVLHHHTRSEWTPAAPISSF